MIFSIITITRNNRSGLQKTEETIASQTLRDFEWIIIDGSSTDGTQDDFAKYTTAKIISEPDNGIYDAMNKGIDKASGEYLIFMNAGDRFASPDTLQKTKEKTGNETCDLIYGDSFENNFLKRAKAHTEIEYGLFTHHQAMFYNRESLGDLRFDTKYEIAADYALTLTFLKDKNRSCFYLSFPVCIFESGGLSQQQVKLGRDEQFRARAKAGVPLLKNIAITQKQKAASLLRRFYPDVYWKIRKD